jgi:hypothetical protein
MVYDYTTSRPDIPAAVDRQLRQEAGFGCCRCGNPIFEYHHIIPWAVEAHFRPEDMMVLCFYHHREFGTAMPEAEQRTYKSRPYKIQHGPAGGLLR